MYNWDYCYCCVCWWTHCMSLFLILLNILLIRDSIWARQFRFICQLYIICIIIPWNELCRIANISIFSEMKCFISWNKKYFYSGKPRQHFHLFMVSKHVHVQPKHIRIIIIWWCLLGLAVIAGHFLTNQNHHVVFKLRRKKNIILFCSRPGSPFSSHLLDAFIRFSACERRSHCKR